MTSPTSSSAGRLWVWRRRAGRLRRRRSRGRANAAKPNRDVSVFRFAGDAAPGESPYTPASAARRKTGVRLDALWTASAAITDRGYKWRPLTPRPRCARARADAARASARVAGESPAHGRRGRSRARRRGAGERRPGAAAGSAKRAGAGREGDGARSGCAAIGSVAGRSAWRRREPALRSFSAATRSCGGRSA